jgi:hypothetical protein
MGSNPDCSWKHAMDATYILLPNERMKIMTDRGKRNVNVELEPRYEQVGYTSVHKVYPLSQVREVKLYGKICSVSAYILCHEAYNRLYDESFSIKSKKLRSELHV